MICPICKSTDSSELFSETIEAAEWVLDNKKYTYQQCHQCNFIHCDPTPSEEELMNFYKDQYAYEWFRKNAYYKKIQAKHRLFKIKKHLQGAKKILDFGCGHGFFVETVARNGFDSHGFDIGVDKIISNKGYKIVNKNRLAEYQEKGFDVITAWHVIEHMRDVQQVIGELKARLNSNGKLIIAVPNMGSLGFKLFRQKWGWTQQPYVHINHFSGNNLSMLLQKNGFKVVSLTTIDTWDQNLYDLLITKLFYKNKSRNTVRQFNSSLRGEVVFRLNQLVRLAFTPVSYAYSFTRSSRNEGSELLIVAEKV